METRAVIARSCLKKKKNKDESRADWTIFEARKTFQKNRPSSGQILSWLLLFPVSPNCKDSTVEYTASVENDTWVAKCGRAGLLIQ